MASYKTQNKNNNLACFRLKHLVLVVLALGLTACASSSKQAPSEALSMLNPDLAGSVQHSAMDEASGPASNQRVNVDQLKTALADARVAYENQDWDAAEGHYQRARSLGAPRETMLYWLGNLAIMTGDLDGAEKYYTSSLSINPKNAKAQYNLATVHLAKAEDHFHFYTATADDEPIDKKLMSLMNAIDAFSSDQEPTKPSQTPLESLRRVLSGN